MVMIRAHSHAHITYLDLVLFEHWKCSPTCQTVRPVTDVYKKMVSCSSYERCLDRTSPQVLRTVMRFWNTWTCILSSILMWLGCPLISSWIQPSLESIDVWYGMRWLCWFWRHFWLCLWAMNLATSETMLMKTDEACTIWYLSGGGMLLTVCVAITKFRYHIHWIIWLQSVYNLANNLAYLDLPSIAKVMLCFWRYFPTAQPNILQCWHCSSPAMDIAK
jgi:hypothetical protein